jgi:hypothetical protein
MISRTAPVIATLASILCIANSARGAAPDDPCALLTEAQVGAALGAQVTVVKYVSDAKHCHWEQGKRVATVVDAHLMVEAAKSYDAAKGMMGMSGKVTRVAVSGLGDDAYYLVGRRDAPLFVKKGNSAIRVAVDGKGWSMEEIKAKEKALASALLAKL